MFRDITISINGQWKLGKLGHQTFSNVRYVSWSVTHHTYGTLTGKNFVCSKRNCYFPKHGFRNVYLRKNITEICLFNPHKTLEDLSLNQTGMVHLCNNHLTPAPPGPQQATIFVHVLLRTAVTCFWAWLTWLFQASRPSFKLFLLPANVYNQPLIFVSRMLAFSSLSSDAP